MQHNVEIIDSKTIVSDNDFITKLEEVVYLTSINEVSRETKVSKSDIENWLCGKNIPNDNLRVRYMKLFDKIFSRINGM